MKIISFITDPHVIRHILEHLGLWVQKSSRDPPSRETSRENGQIVYEPFDDLSACGTHRQVVGPAMKSHLLW